MGRVLQAHLFFMFLLAGSWVSASEKKGIGMAPAQFKCDDFYAFKHINWWYDWSASGVKLKNKNSCTNIDSFIPLHVPMAWGNGTQFPNYYIQDTAQYLLGFNEPNHIAQSDLTAEQAFQLWPEMKRLAAENNLTLVSPAAAPCGKNCNGNATEWFDRFFELCNGNCNIQYLATHVYYCEPDRVMSYLEDLYNRYNLKIWVTEFACPNVTDPAIQLAFMEALLPRLESAGFIFRYAWYISRLITDDMYVKSAVSLLQQDTSELTALGIAYDNFGESTTTSTTTATSTTTVSTTASSTTSSNTVSDVDSTTNNPNSGLSLLGSSNVCIAVMILTYISSMIV